MNHSLHRPLSARDTKGGPLGNHRRVFNLVLLALFVFPPLLHAQTAAEAPEHETKTMQPGSRAPDEVIRQLSALVHAGKYAEAQQLIPGLLIAYPDDDRLIKAQALLATSAAPAPVSRGAGIAGTGSQSGAADIQSNLLASRQSDASSGSPSQFGGMDKVEYAALIELARQAQQTSDPVQQQKVLLTFMERSDRFLQKYPDQMLLWEFRLVASISLNAPLAGHEAGQKLLTAGAANGNDSNLLQLLAQLKNKGWLDKGEAEKHEKFDWLVGSWAVSWNINWHGRGVWPTNHDAIVSSGTLNNEDMVLDLADSLIISHWSSDANATTMEGKLSSSGEVGWYRFYGPATWGSFHSVVWGLKAGDSYYPSGWVPVISCAVSADKRTITLVVPSQDTSASSKLPWSDAVTVTYSKIL
jgi:hypothetical protein